MSFVKKITTVKQTECKGQKDGRKDCPNCYAPATVGVRCIGRENYLIYVSMRHYVLTTSGDIDVCFHTAVCLSC